ncbi:hypothetical protein METH_08425 [Leisingera methylohalidivorans DSM 14336]|uniref:Uncharacterized protein n=1 Tax=Leisingera methylohalidivorans DSM 14336 TaxID=999552 RepID=V9VW66_9RHOB|nr:hypothetical protein METH_08425 [Leisingera methylohalidivorans DSM 14336]
MKTTETSPLIYQQVMQQMVMGHLWFMEAA